MLDTKTFKTVIDEIKLTLGIHGELTRQEQEDLTYAVCNFAFVACTDFKRRIILEDFCLEYENKYLNKNKRSGAADGRL